MESKSNKFLKSFDTSKIGSAPNLLLGDQHESIQHIQSYLNRYGYYSKRAKIIDCELDSSTISALKKFQKQYKLERTGYFDPSTRAQMTEHRCGMRDLNPLAATAVGPWDRKNLTYAFGRLTNQVSIDNIRLAVKNAFSTWEGVNVGLRFNEVSISHSPHILIEWRPTVDHDHDLTGREVAHADYPPPFSEIVSQPPLPIHFDNEHRWAIGAVFNAFDIETVALHEIGHCLGLEHSTDRNSIMYGAMRPNFVSRQLQNDDIVGIRGLYRTIF